MKPLNKKPSYANDLPIKKKPKVLSFSNLLIAFLVILQLIIFFIIRPVTIQGISMEKSFYDKDVVLLWQFQYQPQKNDIVVFQMENDGKDKNLVKRIIGIAGDKIKIEGNHLFVNGEELKEIYLNEQDWNVDSMEYEVPEDQVFVLGDNRNFSLDSRIFGNVPESSIRGKVICRLFSLLL